MGEKVSLEIMYSDKIATIQKSLSEKISLQDENYVSDKVFENLEDNFVKKNDVEIENISILLLSYTNPPKLPKGIRCKNWEIRCESHPPYVTNLLESIPLNSEFLKIESESYGMGRDLLNKWEEMEQGTYEQHKSTCQFEENDPKFAECMLEKVGKEAKCSSADLEKFKESMKSTPGLLKMISDYKDKRDEVERMSEEKNDN